MQILTMISAISTKTGATAHFLGWYPKNIEKTHSTLTETFFSQGNGQLWYFSRKQPVLVLTAACDADFDIFMMMPL